MLYHTQHLTREQRRQLHTQGYARERFLHSSRRRAVSHTQEYNAGFVRACDRNIGQQHSNSRQLDGYYSSSAPHASR